MQQTGQSYAAARQFLRRQPKGTTPVPNTEAHETMATLRETVKDFLAPIAEESNRPLEPALLAALMFDREPDGGDREWTVWLYTLSPGYVIGRKGAVAAALLERLRDAAGDPKLRLNIADFNKVHNRQREVLRDQHDNKDAT